MLKTSTGSVGPFAPQIPQQIHTAHARQRKIEHHDVPFGAAHLGHALFGGGGLANESRVKRARQHLLDALADDRVIVDEKNAGHVCRACSRGARRCVPDGTVTVTVVPRPVSRQSPRARRAGARARSCQAARSSRHSRARRPLCRGRCLGSSTSTSFRARACVMRTAPACACRTTFVSAS